VPWTPPCADGFARHDRGCHSFSELPAMTVRLPGLPLPAKVYSLSLSWVIETQLV